MDTNIRNDVTGRIDGQFDSNFSVGRENHESWKTMLEHFYDDVTRLFERQSLLMRTEIKEKIDDVKVAMSSVVIGASLLLVGVFALAATAIIVLDLVLPLWASALLVTAVLMVVGGVMVMGAKKKLTGERLAPTHSLETLSEIKTTFKERINEFKSHGHH